MGNDGGSIPTRRELVKEAARNPSATELKAAAAEAEQHRWTADPLSACALRPLVRPVVSDACGRLYNKDSLIEHLLPPADADDAAAMRRRAELERDVLGAAGVRSLRDVVEVRFEAEGEGEAEAEGAGGSGEGSPAVAGVVGGANGGGVGMRGGKEVWVCPITREELGPGTKAVYLVPCGHAFKGEVIKEAGGERVCLKCNEPYAPNDVIPIVPTSDEDIARLQLRMKTLKEKGLTHSLKKAPGGGKKRKNGDSGEDKAGTKAAKKNGESKKEKKEKAAAAADGIKNSATASLTARVLAEQEERNKRRKMAGNNNIDSLFSKDNGQARKKNDFMTRGFDVHAEAKR